MTADRRAVITGMGLVSPFGIGKDAFLDNVVQGKSAASLVTSVDVSKLPTRFAGQVPDDNDKIDSMIKNQKSLKAMSRSSKFGVIAADEAVSDAGLDTGRLDPYRIGTSIGAGGLGIWDADVARQTLRAVQDSFDKREVTFDYAKVWRNTLDRVHPLTSLKALANIGTAHIAINHNARGICQTISTACTSSTQAIGEAYRQIKFGFADVMITGGSDAMVNPNALVGFSALGVLSKNNDEYKTASRPFDKRRDGFMIGEGAAVFVLEEVEHAKKRGGRIYGEIVGFANTNDAFRLTDEPPEAWGTIQAMKMALEDARISPETVDYINAHGTGTRMNDVTETRAIKNVFKERAYAIPVSSTKSMIGHLVAAAGAVEFAACVLAMEHRVIPPTINYEVPDPHCDLDYVPNEAREASLNTILSNSFGFGGQNACLVLRSFTS